MKKRIVLMLLFSMVLIVAAAACGTGEENEATNESNQNANDGNQNEDNANAEENAEQDTNENSNANADTEGDSYSIAIAQYVEHPSLDATREGILDALADAGIEEGTNLTVDYNNAQADSTNNLSIAQDIATGDYDLILPIATPPAQAIVEQVEDMPVVFSAVTDPLDSVIVDDLEHPGGNVTGGADTNPEAITMLMDFIAEHFPEVETVGVVINEGEPNAVVMTDQAEEALAEHGIELIRASVPTTSEVKQAAESLVGRADAIYITLDNMVVSGVDTVIEVAEENDIPFFSSDRDTVEAGAFATVGFRYYDHGYQVGQMAEDILKNGTDPGEMAVTFPDQLDYILNLQAAEAQGIEVTDAMKDMVNDPDDNIIE